MQRQSSVSDSRKGRSESPEVSAPPIDPVCGMALEGSPDELEQAEHDGTTYYFCSPDCREQFQAGPQDFVD
jgi:YHS domain-containing protein